MPRLRASASLYPLPVSEPWVSGARLIWEQPACPRSLELLDTVSHFSFSLTLKAPTHDSDVSQVIL